MRVLSAGQRRRVAMARVLAMRAPLWLLDEPFTNLDAAGPELMSPHCSQEHVDGGGMALVVAHHELELDRADRAAWSSAHERRRLAGAAADHAA